MFSFFSVSFSSDLGWIIFFSLKLKYAVGKSSTSSEDIIHHCRLCRVLCNICFCDTPLTPKGKIRVFESSVFQDRFNELRDSVWYLASIIHYSWLFIPNYAARWESNGMKIWHECTKIPLSKFTMLNYSVFPPFFFFFAHLNTFT